MLTLHPRLATPLLAAALLLAGCDDPRQSGGDASPTLPSQSRAESGRNVALAALPELAGDIQAVRIDLPETPPAHQTSDAALVEALRASGGRAYIGFKPPTARPTHETGIIPAMTRAQALEGRTVAERHGARVERAFRLSSTIVAVIPPEAGPLLRRLAIVNYVEPAAVGSSAHSYPAQDTTWGVRKVRAPQAWTMLLGSGAHNLGQYANIVILDSGVDYDHLLNPDGDGPANMSLSDCLYTATSTITSCYDDLGHGSNVASIAAARAGSYGYIGVAYYPQSVSSVKVLDRYDYARHEDVAGALEWTATNGRTRQIVNMSLVFGSGSTLMSEYVSRSYNAGNLLVASAGNRPRHTSITYPARYSQVIAVTGTNESDGFASSSVCGNSSVYGSQAELSAPFTSPGAYLHMDYRTYCGTSQASPVVAGVAALVWTRYPTWSRDQVRSRLQSSAADLGAAGRDAYFGYGRVDAVNALTDPFTVAISGPVYGYEEYLTLNAATSDGASGSYYYVWEHRWCFNGSAPGDCDGLWHPKTEGWGVTSVQSYIQAEDQYVDVRVFVRSSPTGPNLATDTHHITGANEGGDCSVTAC